MFVVEPAKSHELKKIQHNDCCGHCVHVREPLTPYVHSIKENKSKHVGKKGCYCNDRSNITEKRIKTMFAVDTAFTFDTHLLARLIQ